MWKSGGNTIPIVFVTSPDGSKGIKGIPYKELSSDMRKSVRELKKTLEESPVESGEAVTPEQDQAAESDTASEPESKGFLVEEQEWTNASGKSMRAAVRAVTDSDVVFVMAGGKVVNYPLFKLSRESQAALAKLR